MRRQRPPCALVEPALANPGESTRLGHVSIGRRRRPGSHKRARTRTVRQRLGCAAHGVARKLGL